MVVMPAVMPVVVPVMMAPVVMPRSPPDIRMNVGPGVITVAGVAAGHVTDAGDVTMVTCWPPIAVAVPAVNLLDRQTYAHRRCASRLGEGSSGRERRAAGDHRQKGKEKLERSHVQSSISFARSSRRMSGIEQAHR